MRLDLKVSSYFTLFQEFRSFPGRQKVIPFLKPTVAKFARRLRQTHCSSAIVENLKDRGTKHRHRSHVQDGCRQPRRPSACDAKIEGQKSFPDQTRNGFVPALERQTSHFVPLALLCCTFSAKEEEPLTLCDRWALHFRHEVASFASFIAANKRTWQADLLCILETEKRRYPLPSSWLRF